ncbi:Uncharacterised protein [Bifidobacterium breve]|nr:hypothetical protein [Bifidobacterium breve]VUX30465.1 Uncharacterised protein [Bifidobacterium breve]
MNFGKMMKAGVAAVAAIATLGAGGVVASTIEQIGRAVQQECRDRSRMPSSA